MSQEHSPVLEEFVQITPEERAEFDRIRGDVVNTFNFFIALYDKVENEDKKDLFEFLESANTLAGRFNTLYEEVSSEDFSPQSSVVALLRSAEKMHDQLDGVKGGLQAKMQTLGYEINIKFIDDESSEPEPEPVQKPEPEPATKTVIPEPVVATAVPLALAVKAEAVAPKPAELKHESVTELDALTTSYKMADASVFQITDGPEKSKRKTFKLIRAELKTVFDGQKYGEYGARFLNEIVDTVGKKISALNIQKKTEKNWQKREEINRLINGLYADLLQDVAVFMQTVKVDMEDGISPEAAPPEEGQHDIDNDISIAIDTFKALSEQLPTTSPIRLTPEFIDTAQAVAVLAEFHEEDPVRAASDRSRMNKVLQNRLTQLVLVYEKQHNVDTEPVVGEVLEVLASELVEDGESLVEVVQADVEPEVVEAAPQPKAAVVAPADVLGVEAIDITDREALKELDDKFSHVKDSYIGAIQEILMAAGLTRLEDNAAVQSVVDRYNNLDESDQAKLLVEKKSCLKDLQVAGSSLGRVSIKRTSGVMENDWGIVNWSGTDKTEVLVMKTYSGGHSLTKLISISDLASYNTNESVESNTEAVTEKNSSANVVESINSKEDQSDFVKKYHKKRTEWKVFKDAFTEKERNYQTALSEYFQADSWKAKLRAGLFNTKKLIGLNPDLPPALEVLRAEYYAIRGIYAESLDAAMKARSKVNLENIEYETDSDTTKAAFASKFILKPSQKIVSLQERAVLSPEQQSRLTRVMQMMAKYKWLTRVGMVTAAGVVGGLSGGIGLAAAGASWQASKIALSAGAGAGAAYVTRKGLQGRIDTATNALTSTEADVKNNFSLRKLRDLDDSFTTALSAKKLAERQQKTATVVAAVAAAAAGSATGFAAGTFGQEEVAAAVSKETIATAVRLNLASEAPLVTTQPEAIEVQSDVKLNPVAIAELKITSNGLDGSVSRENVLSDISFGPSSNAESLTTAQRTELTSFVKLKAEDLLSAHPHMSEAQLESELFKSIQNKFTETSWWSDAKISQVDIGKFELRPVEAVVTTPVPEVPTEEVSELSEASSLYVVQKGDSLTDIVEKNFAENLKGLTESERNAALDSVFDKIQNNPELKSSLGLRSGDVDLVYAGEKLNLSVLESQLENVLERNEIIEQFTRSAPVTITPDAEAQTIPITVVEKPIVGGTEITHGSTSYTEAVPTAETIGSSLVPPRPFAINGQYSEQPEYREYITKVFGNGKAFEQAVERAVNNFDNGTYDIFERSPLFGGVTYESPYRLLSEMSLEDVREFKAQSNEEIRYFLSQNNIKYNTYLTWVDQIDKMTKTLPSTSDTTVRDLFSRYIAEHDYLVAH